MLNYSFCNTSLFVILFQSDCMSALEKDRDYREEHFDFIQQHIRRHCLKCILINTYLYSTVKWIYNMEMSIWCCTNPAVWSCNYRVTGIYGACINAVHYCQWLSEKNVDIILHQTLHVDLLECTPKFDSGKQNCVTNFCHNFQCASLIKINLILLLLAFLDSWQMVPLCSTPLSKRIRTVVYYTDI